jgi:hypothetical protein
MKEDDAMTSLASGSGRKKGVRFDKVRLHTHKRILGDNLFPFPLVFLCPY